MSALQYSAMMLLLTRDAGFLALVLVLQAQLSGERFEATGVGLARSHPRRVFGEAEAAGYVRLPGGRGSVVELLPALWDAYDRFLAGVEAGQDAIAQTAFRDLAQPSKCTQL